MQVSFESPKEYKWGIPIFEDKPGGPITQDRSRNAIENILSAYSVITKKVVDTKGTNPLDYLIKDVYLVGSGARENRINSDIDIMLITPDIDEESANQMKYILAMMFFTDRPKNEAIDVYVRKKDAYPLKSSYNVTDQVADLLNKCNETIIAYVK